MATISVARYIPTKRIMQMMAAILFGVIDDVELLSAFAGCFAEFEVFSFSFINESFR